MDLKVNSTGIQEPVTVEEMKTLMGYKGTDMDSRIRDLITVAREWLENRTGLSCVSKEYTAYFEKGDRDSSGWYELPVSPVASAPAIALSVCGVSTTYEQKGMNQVKVRPAVTYGTIQIGGGSETYYVEVVFTAGAANKTANECIRRIVNTMFNNPQDGSEVSLSRIPYDTLQLIDSIDQNTGL
jgi:hypothetical protein